MLPIYLAVFISGPEGFFSSVSFGISQPSASRLACVIGNTRYSLVGVFKEYFDSGATMPYVLNHEKLDIPSFFKRGLDYEVAKLKYFIEKNYILDIPYSLVYDFMKLAGYFLGSKSRYIPKSLKKILSKKSNHWDKYESSI